MQNRHLIIIMGVSGCGKSTLARCLSDNWGCPWIDADDFHSAGNIAKMSSGTPLTDQDRIQWVDDMAQRVDRGVEPLLILACSALTPLVQDRLGRTQRAVTFIHLDTQHVDMTRRLRQRDHFMPASLLRSQYEALCVPDGAIIIDANQSVDTLSAKITASLSPILQPHQTRAKA